MLYEILIFKKTLYLNNRLLKINLLTYMYIHPKVTKNLICGLGTTHLHEKKCKKYVKLNTQYSDEIGNVMRDNETTNWHAHAFSFLCQTMQNAF